MEEIPDHSINYTAVLPAATACAVGDVLVPNSGGTAYVVSTAAARSSGVRSECVALSAWGGSGVGSVRAAQNGILPASKSLLPVLTSGSPQLVRVSSVGRLERIASYTTGDDVVGFAELSGRVHLHFGLPWTQILTVAGIPGGALGQVQYWGTGSVFNGTPHATVDPTTEELSFGDGKPIRYTGSVGGTIAAPFSGLVTNATEPAILVSLPIRAAAHAGVVQVSAKARWATGDSVQVLTVEYTYTGGTVTLGLPVDGTPTGMADATGVITFATRDVAGVDYIDILGSANGNTNWAGQVQITMADTP